MSDIVIRAASPVQRWSDAAGYQLLARGASVGSILVLKLDHVGDFILSFEALICLRRAFPAARIDLACAPWNEAFARALDLFEQIYPMTVFSPRADHEQPVFEPARIASLRGKHWDLAIDLRVDPDTRAVLRQVDATWRVGFESPAERDIMTMFLPHAVLDADSPNIAFHQSSMMLRLVRSTADLFQPPVDSRALLLGRIAEAVDLDLSAAQGRFLVLVNTASGRAAKNWPLDRFCQLVAWLVAGMDATVLLVGGPDQMAETAELLAFCASPHVLSAVGRTTLRQCVSLIAQASLYVGNDTGLTHVAAKLGIPTVALFSGIDPTAMWAAVGEHVTILKAPVPCSPCHIQYLSQCIGRHACMRNISQGTVQAAVRRHLFRASRFGDPLAVGQPSIQDLNRDAGYRGWIGTGRIETPPRYDANYDRYIAKGGQLPLAQMMQGYVAEQPPNVGDMNRFYALALIFDQIIKEGIAGDIAVVGAGGTATLPVALARRLGITAFLVATSDGAEAPPAFSRLIGSACVDYVPGPFPGTADRFLHDREFCLVLLDCGDADLCGDILGYCYPRLAPGGFLVVHDYSSLNQDGSERAVDAFLADKPESLVPVPDGTGMAVLRRMTPSSAAENWFVRGTTSGFANNWVRASSDDVTDFLASGWSTSEPWGTWGLGDRHVLRLALARPPAGDVELTVDSSMVLLPGRETNQVEIRVAGEQIGRWDYTRARNGAVRRVRIPRRLIAAGEDAAVVMVEFRPAACEPPRHVDPANTDNRPLGLGLVRFRQRPLGSKVARQDG